MRKLLLIVLPLLLMVGCYNDEELRKQIEMQNEEIDELRSENDALKHQYVDTYENGNPKRIGNYKIVDNKIVQDGLVTFWHEHGQKIEEITYKDGKKNGLYTKFYENGQKEFERTYKDEKLDGLYTKWYENGQKSEEGTYRIGSFGEKGKISYKTGQWTYWYKNGQKLREGSHSSATAYTSKGEGVEIGTWSMWYENGQKEEERTYKDGKRDGLWTKWYENGQKKWEGTYKDGKLDGLLIAWSDNGELVFEGTYESRFDDSGKFNCFDGSKSVRESWINDGGCDCGDCSDELFK